MWDLLIRGGTVVDGTGRTPYEADVAIDDGLIVAVAPDLDGDAREVIDATGLTVAPGFVDIHTHYDGQMTWDDLLEPSVSHGVTTIVAGNCGVGFAPVKPDAHTELIELMEGVEDIPGTALHEGITWDWETFPEYLDAIDKRAFSMDVAVMIPHGAVRTYVMGPRGTRNEEATPADIEAMAEIVREAVAAGALGFSSSRTTVHRSKSGEPVPGTFAAREELLGIAHGVAAAEGRMFEVVPLEITPDAEFDALDEIDLLATISRETGLAVTFPVLQAGVAPDLWRVMLDAADTANAAGARLVPQIASRPFGMLVGLPTYHAFGLRPTYRRLLAELPYDEMVVEMAKPAVKARILAEHDDEKDPTQLFDGLPEYLRLIPDQIFTIGEPADYEPTSDRSITAIAEAQGRDPIDVLYDLMLTDGGRRLFLVPFLNYSGGDHEVIAEMMEHPGVILGLSDGGAHARMICDASLSTHLLTHWVRDRTRGRRFPIEKVVKQQCHDTARAAGMTDRGVLAEGMRADVNIIDLDNLTLHAPQPVDDLPAGGRRIVQGASGYVATIVGGVVTRRDDTDTGARPGRLIRGSGTPRSGAGEPVLID